MDYTRRPPLRAVLSNSETPPPTSFDGIEDALLNDLRKAGLPKPQPYAPFPPMSLFRPISVGDGVIGEGPNNEMTESVKPDFIESFHGKPPCDAFALTNPPNPWRVFVAFHETSHYVANHLKSNGISLSDRVYSSINGIPPQDSTAYVASYLKNVGKVMPLGQKDNIETLFQNQSNDNFIKIIRQDPKLDQFTASLVSYAQLRERTADAGATLYMLSNYGNTPEVGDFLQKVMDFRTAHYLDSTHDTASSIQAAIKAYAAKPTPKMSIVEANQWAADIVQTQPELNQGVNGWARDIRNKYEVGGAMIQQGADTKTGLIERIFDPNAHDQKVFASTAIVARARVCVRMP
jgi:hypothetical protein